SCGNVCATGQTCQNSACVTQQTCGNGVLEGAEVCDSSNLNGQTCVTKGFTGGTLSCSSCTFNTTGCTNTIVDTTPPTVSITSPTGGSTQLGSITITATASDNVGVAGVQFKIDGVNLGAEDTNSPYSIIWNTTSYTNANHVITVTGRDAAGNLFTSISITVSVNNALPDTTPSLLSGGSPSGNLLAGANSTTISLTTNEAATCKYSASAGVAYASMPSTFTTTGGTTHSKLLIGLTSSSTYNYYVKCVDGVGNANTNDFTITFSIPAADTIPPVRSSGAPVGTLSGDTTSAVISLATNEAAMCKYSTASGIAYSSMVNTFSTTGSTLHSVFVTGLTSSSTYNYYIRCIDGAGNADTNDFTITFSIQAAADTTSPSIPTNLIASAASYSQTNLSWSVSTDNVGVIGYRLERCQGISCTSFTQIATPTGNLYSDIGLAANTSYKYRVRAQDAAGNPSGYSSIAGVTTQQAPIVQSTNTTLSAQIPVGNSLENGSESVNVTTPLTQKIYSGLDI
ncbi:MAG: Ig-like domain-containing protein, partial [Patescibacteria group bacterium]